MQKDNMTVGQWCGQWFTANRCRWNSNTEGGYRNLIYSHIIPGIGNVVLSDLMEQTVTDFYDTLRNQGLGARSVWCVHLLLRRCMDEAAREQFIPYNPVRLCQESKAEGYKAAPLRLGQLQRYLNAAEQLGVLPLIYTGLRDAVLRRFFFLIRSVRSCDGGFDLFSFGAGQLFLFGQFDTPPGLTGFAAPERHKNCWSYTGAASASGSTRGRCCG